MDLCCKGMSLLLNMLSRLVIAFLPRSKGLLISDCRHSPQWFWSSRRWNLLLLPLFPHLFAMKEWDWMPWSSFLECWVFCKLVIHPVQHFSWCILRKSWLSRVTIYSLDVLLSQFWTICSMSDSNCCFLTCIQVSQVSRWSGIPIFFTISHSWLWPTQSKASA